MSEIQETYATLTEIDRLLASIELKINSIEGKAPALERNLNTFRQLERIILRYLTLTRRMGLPDDVDATIQRLMRVLIIIRMIQMSMTMFATGGTMGVLAGVAGATMAMTSVMEGY